MALFRLMFIPPHDPLRLKIDLILNGGALAFMGIQVGVELDV